MKKISSFVALGLLFAIPQAATATKIIPQSDAQYATAFFADVSAEHPNAEGIGFLKKSGVVEGYGNGTFMPDFTINRAEFMKIVIATIDSDPKGENCFEDVHQEWFAKYLCTGKKMGIVEGYHDGKFRPELNINFAEASKIVVKAFGLKESATKQKDIWFKKYAEALEEEKAIPVSIDYPEKKITRGEMSEIAWRLKANIEQKPTKTFSNLMAELPTIDSCAELKEKVSLEQYKQNRKMMIETFAEESEAPSDTEEVSEKQSIESIGGYSTTNVQVEGVDEADVVKTDGKYIYLIKANTIRIVEAVPPDKIIELSKVEIKDSQNFYPSEMYVTGNNLVVIGSSYSEKTKTDVYLFDITDKKNVTQKRKVSFDGNYVSSRRIKDNIYFVMNDHRPFHILEEANGENIVPQYFDSKKGTKEPLAECDSIRFFPRYSESNFLIVASVPLDDGQGDIERHVYMGSGSTVYSSPENLYVATLKYENDETVRYDFWEPHIQNIVTVFYRFELHDGQIEYKGNGAVAGTPLNQFSMDEDSGSETFRIATTKGEFWGDEKPTNQLYIVDRNDLNKIVAKVENIGVNEKIKSIRFMGKRVYMVTFRNTDPFFVIDLSDPKAPKILGELKIPGYSDYLHPYDENHIIGFGKEAVAADKNFAWYQGMKIAVFDVTDVTQPKQLFQEIIGDRGTDSELLYNHKALLFSKAKNLIAFPVEVAEIQNKNPAKPDPSAYGSIVFRGAYVYSFDLEKGFELKGKVTHFEKIPEDPEGIGLYYYGINSPIIRRLLYIGENLYSISGAKVQAHSLNNLQKQGEVALEKTSESEGEEPVYIE